MADTVATLSTTLQGQIAGAGPSPATMQLLYQALVAGATPLWQARVNRRIGLLNVAAGGIWDMVMFDADQGKVAMNFSECKEAQALVGTLPGVGSGLAKCNPNDPACIVANCPASQVLALANQLVTLAASYEAMEVEVLPA